ncbi:putative DNA-binding protein (MmcQ/YjbR family) [Luteimonas cucumeris]|uniref:Putative DNA-binding protein (MmcQ/YjbR family) n=1 Tax=Luteimonas cucumeris TaxID=985012 RepID=A0A562L6V8_9GAMM|nr:MmcQ/YjbR family DNA-binding protein [Luteimonas cucumeris]TWI03417.1 putative DNA-binding protein (MmcQ/YjbR family) [Luteimonas cucumeris]
MKIAAVRRLVSAWPGVSEDVKWSGVLVFSVGGKMFCAMRVAAAGGLAFRVEAERFLEYTDRPGVVPAPFLARWHWVSLAVPDALPDAEVRVAIRRSYELVRGRLSRKLQREFAD